MRGLRYLRDRFYEGPRDMGIKVPRRGSYQSPTLTALLWAYAFVARHLTMPARIILLCAVLIVPYAMISLLMPLYILAFAIAALFIVDVVTGFLMTPHVYCRRTTPPRVAAHSRFMAGYRVENRGRRPAWDVRIDTLPMPGALRFVHGRPFFQRLGPGEEQQARVTMQAGRRGEYTLPSVRADSTVPFCLWRWGKTSGYNGKLMVHPVFTPLTVLELPAGRQYQPGGVAYSSNIGESMEFRGCRDFRDGDNPRHIHWRSWARTGKPVVKEFQEEYFYRTALIVDTNPPGLWKRHVPGMPDEMAAFEAALSLTGAVADYLARHDGIVDLFAAGKDVYQFRSGRGTTCLEHILDILACLQPQHGDAFADLHQALQPHVPNLSGVVLLVLDWSPARRQLLEQIETAGVEVKTVFIGEQQARAPAELPSDATVLTAEDVGSGRVMRL